MSFGLLEHEIRRLSHVVAVAVDDHQVSVLLDPAGDADATSVVVAALLATAGLDRSVRVLGGSRAAATRPSRVGPVLAGTAAGVGVLSMVAAAAAMQGLLPVPVLDPIRQALSPTSAAPAPEVAAPAPGERVIVPGRQPRWAARGGTIPLPAAPAELEVADVDVDAAVAAALLAADEAPAEPVRRRVRTRRPVAPVAAPVATAPVATPAPQPAPVEPKPIRTVPVEPVVVETAPEPDVEELPILPTYETIVLEATPTAPARPEASPQVPPVRVELPSEADPEQGGPGRGHGRGHEIGRGRGHDGHSHGRGHAGRDR